MEPASCKCSPKGRNLIVCIDGTSNQFGTKNTNVVELYSKIEKTEDSNQLTYYNSGIGTYAKPSWKSLNYLMQVLDNTVDLAIAWNFERIIIGAYRWLSDNYQENDRIFLFGFSRGAYQVRALAGMIQRVGLIHKGNEEQIPFAYALYATHTEDLATRFKTTFSRENVTVHFVGVWDTVSSVGVIRGRNLPLTDSAEHVCFFRHALALDERRVKFLPEYVHGGVCQNPTAPEQSQIGLNSASARIKEVWFPGTHSDIGGGNQANLDLDLGGTPFLWMSFEAVSCGLRLRPTKVEWNLEHLHDVKESLTGVWKIFEWMPFKRLSYKDESSTNYRPHKGRGRKIKPGQKVHSSVAFCNESYQPRAILPARRRLSELVGKGSRSNREWVEGWEDLLEMDIFDLSLMSNVIETLKSGTAGGESPMWVYRLTAMTSTVEGLAALRGRPDIGNDLVQIFTSAGQRVEVQECVTAILEKVSKDQTSILLSSEHCLWLLRVARETAEMNRRSFAVKLLVNTLSQDQSYEHILNEQALGALDEMARDEQHPWLTDGAFAMFTTILSQNTLSQKLFAANTLAIVRRRFTAEDSRSQEVAKCLFKTILQSAENRQRLFDNDVMHSWLTKIENLNDTERLIFTSFLANQYEYLPNAFFTLLTSKLWDEMNSWEVHRSRHNLLYILTDTIDSDGLRKRIWNSEIVKALRRGFNQDPLLRSLIFKLYSKCIIYESLRNEVFNTDTAGDLGRALRDGNRDVRENAISFLIAAIAHEGFRDKLFDAEIITALEHALDDDEDPDVRRRTVEFFTAAMVQEGFGEKIFEAEIITALGHALYSDSSTVYSLVHFFTAAISQEEFWGKLFHRENITALASEMDHSHDDIVRSGVLNFFITAAAQEGLQEIFDTDTVIRLIYLLDDVYDNIRNSAISFFTDMTNQEWFRNKIFDTRVIANCRYTLCQDPWTRRASSVIQFFTFALAQEGFLSKLFDKEIHSALVHALGGYENNGRSRRSAISFITAAIAQVEFQEKIFDPELIATVRCALSDKHWVLRQSAVHFFTTVVAQERFWDKVLDSEIIATLVSSCAQDDHRVRESVIEFFTVATAEEGFWDKIFNNEIIATLRNALRYKQCSAISFFTAVITQKGFQDKIFDTEIIASLRDALSDSDFDVRRNAVRFFTAAIPQEGFWDKLFDNKIVAALVHAITDQVNVNAVINFFTAASAQEGFWDQIFGNKIIATLGDKTKSLRSSRIHIVHFFINAIAQEGLQDKIINTQTVAAMIHALSDSESVDYFQDIREAVVRFFTLVIAQEGLRDKIIDTKIAAAMKHALGDEGWLHMINFFTAVIGQEGFRDNIFDTRIIAALGHALSVERWSRDAICFFIAAIAQEGFRDKIFNTKIITALVRTLGASAYDVVSVAFDFFITAMAQVGFRDKIFGAKVISALLNAYDHAYDSGNKAAIFFMAAIDQGHVGFRDKIFDASAIARLVQVKNPLPREFWSNDYILPRVYNHFITSTLCQQLASPDLSLRDQTFYFVSEAIKYDDVHTRICTAELRKHFSCPHTHDD